MTPLTPVATAARAALRNGLGNAGLDLLRRVGLALGAVIGGGILAAIHQLVAEEGRTLIRHAVGDLARRRRRNERILLAILGTELPLEHQGESAPPATAGGPPSPSWACRSSTPHIARGCDSC